MGRVVVCTEVSCLVLVDLVVATGEERPEDLDKGKKEDDTRRDGDRDEDDDASREEICVGSQ